MKFNKLIVLFCKGASITLVLLIILATTWSIEIEKSEKPRILSGETSTIFNFPYMVSLIHLKNSQILGSGTILTANCVLFSVNVLDRVLIHFKDVKFKVFWIYVQAGVGYLQPKANYLGVYKKVVQIIIGDRPKVKYNIYNVSYPITRYKGILNSTHLEKHARNALGDIQNDVGLLKIDGKFEWKRTLIPVPLVGLTVEELKEATKMIYKADLTGPDPYGPCVVPGWGPLGNNILMTHRVFHVPFEDCQEAICAQLPNACLEYPQKYYHVCFKSDSYGDVCAYDQGAALYCPWFHDSALAILVRAFDCGLSGLPGVYALIDRAVDIAEVEAGKGGLQFVDNLWKTRKHWTWYYKEGKSSKISPEYNRA